MMHNDTHVVAFHVDPPGLWSLTPKLRDVAIGGVDTFLGNLFKLSIRLNSVNLDQMMYKTKLTYTQNCKHRSLANSSR